MCYDCDWLTKLQAYNVHNYIMYVWASLLVVLTSLLLTELLVTLVTLMRRFYYKDWGRASEDLKLKPAKKYFILVDINHPGVIEENVPQL